jgi:hypothetical protein
MTSSQLHRAKNSTLPAGHPPATAPPTRSSLPTPHCRRVFRLFPTALARLRTPIAPISPPKASRPRSTPQSTSLIPHSRSCTVGCQTSPDLCRTAFLGRLLLPRVDSVLMQASEKPQQRTKARAEHIESGLPQRADKALPSKLRALNLPLVSGHARPQLCFRIQRRRVRTLSLPTK